MVPEYTTSRGGGAKKEGHRRISVFAALGKLDDLNKIRDENLEHAQAALSAWLAAQGGMPTIWQAAPAPRTDGSIGSPLADCLRGYSNWRSHDRLRGFVAAWASCRVPGDTQIYDLLRAWSDKDRHLEEWAANQRAHMQAQRKEAWRLVACDLARTYATILVGKSKLTEIDNWEQPEPEDGNPSEGREQRRMSRVAASGELRAEIRKAAHKTGAVVVDCEEVQATQRCHVCGCEEPWDAAPSIMHTCSRGHAWDQDANHCHNLLIRGGYASAPVPPGDGPVLDPNNHLGSHGNAGSSGARARARKHI